MNKIIMDISPSSAQTAYVEDGKLKELFIDTKKGNSIVGNIYVGIVKNVVSKQFVFIDIGHEKNAFLQLNDPKEQAYLQQNKINIGQHVPVQVVKDETQEKGPCVTTELSLSGRGMALLPRNSESKKRIFISSKIKDAAKKAEIEALTASFLPQGCDAVIRTNCKDMTGEEIKEDFNCTYEKYKDILNKSRYTKGPTLIYTEDFYYSKSLKALLNDRIDEIVVNSEAEFEHIASILSPYKLGDKLHLYEGEITIFDEYGIEKQIRTALNTKVWLKSGGFIVIEKTEACHVIDVNTGKFTTKKNKEKTVLKNNLEAAEEIARQIRLRNLSGMIIIDFVDMTAEENRKWLLAHFRKELAKDRLAVHVVNMSSLNLVQITRKKTRPEIASYFMKSCPLCDGTGLIYNVEYICERIYNMVNRALKQTIYNRITVSSNSKVISCLKNMDEFNNLKKIYNADIIFDTISTGKLDYFEIVKERKGV